MEHKKYKKTVAYVLLHADIFLLLLYLAFRADVLKTLLHAFDVIAMPPDFEKFRFLVWGSFLFLTCAVCSYCRKQYFSIPKSFAKGIVVFELMILSAVVLSVGRSLFQEIIIDPYWLVNLSFISYLFEIVTTAGAGYVLADFLSRFRLIFNKI